MVFALAACGEPMTAEEFFAAIGSDSPNFTINESEVHESPGRRLERNTEIRFDGETLFENENDGGWVVSLYEISSFLYNHNSMIEYFLELANDDYTISGNVLTVNEDKLLGPSNLRIIFGTQSADIEVTHDQFDENDNPIDPIIYVTHFTKIGSTTITAPSGLPEAE